jgi:hypothetical protein
LGLILLRDFFQDCARPKNILSHHEDTIARIAPASIGNLVPVAWDSMLRQLRLQMERILFGSKKPYQMIVPDLRGDVLEEELASLVFAPALKNGRAILPSFRVKDTPESFLLFEAEHVRAAATNGKVVGTAPFRKQASF